MLPLRKTQDVDELKAIIAEKDAVINQQRQQIAGLEEKLLVLQHQIDNLLRHCFGQRSEKGHSLLEDHEDGDIGGDTGEEQGDIEFEDISYSRIWSHPFCKGYS